MDLKEYRIEFLNEIRNNAEQDGNDPQNEFLNNVLDRLEEAEEIRDPILTSCYLKGQRSRIMAFDAYAYDEADSSIELFAVDFNNTQEATTLTNTIINDLCNHMLNFIDEAYNGNIRNYCDESNEIIDVAAEFKEKIGKNRTQSEIIKFKLFVITNSVLSTSVKSINRDDFLDRPVEVNIWTLERFFQLYNSHTSEEIEIKTSDFNCEGIQCIKADINDFNEYDAYLAIMPGKFLADIYLKHGSRLLQGNVRAFLSVRGKVNKGIRNTIIKRPSRFFTYNNGIAVIARSIKLNKEKTKIIEFHDLQIINGGQTTASLASAIIKKDTEDNLANIFVPMKLTVINANKEMSEEEEKNYNELAADISKSANCQNPVTDADFFSNHPFHVEMENLSKRYLAPPVNGKPFGTTWFYERSRGKWEQEQMKLTKSEREKYVERSPKKQVVKKEKLAKCLNAINCKPSIVCSGNAYNMNAFAPSIDELWNNSKDSINEFFFKKSIASVILFDTTDKIVNDASWYPKGGNKAQIVPYTIAKLIQSIPSVLEIDWMKIWQKQLLYSELVQEIEKIAYFTHTFLLESNGVIVREYAKKIDTWKKFQTTAFELDDRFLQTLVQKKSIKEEESSAKRTHKFNNDIDITVDVFKRGYEYWMNFYKDIEDQRLLPAGDCDFVKSIAGYIKRCSLPTPSQIRRLKKIIYKAEDLGYIMKD